MIARWLAGGGQEPRAAGGAVASSSRTTLSLAAGLLAVSVAGLRRPLQAGVCGRGVPGSIADVRRDRRRAWQTPLA
jgi:hypothetical protein